MKIRAAAADELREVVRIDDDASQLYADHGLPLRLDATHPFTVDEQARWRRAVELGRLFFAIDEDTGQPVALASLDVIDEAPYLDQLSVHRSFMRRGIGRALLGHAALWARERGDSLWLTTYAHLPFNRPFYEREGFVVVPEDACSPGIVHHLEEQRDALPAPEHRVAMKLVLGDRSEL